MALDLPSVLGGLAQGFLDFGKSTVDLLGTGTASVADLVQSGGKSTKNQDDFRKWLYKTGSVEDAAAKGLGTALNGAQTIVDFIPPVSAITKTPLGNGLQGAVGGLADEFKEYGKDYDLARAGERAAISGGAAIASGGLSDALKGSANSLLSSGAIRGLASGGIAGGVTGGGYAAIDGGDILEGAKQGASMGALVGGATGLGQDFRPAKTYEIPLTEEEKALRVKTIDDQVANLDTSTPDGAARLKELTRARAVYDTAPENIQRLYHQTSANSFEEFSPEKRASGVMDQGTPTGIFLKENNNDIGLPGKNQLQFDVKMENPYQVDSRDALANYARSRSKTYADLYDQAVELDKKSADVYNEFTNKLDDVYKKYYYEQDATKKAALKKDVDYLINNIKSLSEEKASEYRRQGADVARKAQEELNRVLREDGYDSVILANDEGSFGRKIKSYIALSPYEQMAEIKKMPLEQTLSASENAINSAKLSPEQEAFFKGSAIRDADGNLMPVYHSSPNKFTAFDDSRLGQNTMYDNTGYGHFVTTDQDFSRRFRDINNTGVDGNTMELYADVKNPITHPYGAHYKYSGDDLEKILVDYYNAIENPDAITALKEYATENGTNMYDEYMSLLMGGESPFENVPGERDALKRAGYDAVEFVEGLKKDLVDGSTDDTPISSYAVFSGNKLKDVNNLRPTADADIMYSKVAEGQLGLFDQPIAETEAVDAVNTKNPYAPVDGKVTKAMKDRYNELMASADGFSQITDNELYNKIDKSTLPKGYDKLQQLLDNQMGENNRVAAELKKGIGTDMPLQADLEKLADYVYGDEINGKNTFLKDLDDSIRLNRKNAEFVGIDAEQAEADARSHAKQKLVSKAMEKAERKVIDDIVGTGDSDDILYALQNYRRRGIRTGRAGALDTALSERLGIAPGNTVKVTDATSDDHLRSGTLGRYARNKRDIALSDINSPEGKISTMAHERLHSFQNEARPESAGRYSPEVAEAYKELQKDLGHHYKSHAEIRKHWKKSVDYYADSGEQESRMFQQYLENKGYTDNSAYRGLMNQSGEWGNEINPAFDKFINKLRDLSKRGVALPALATLFGGGAYMANQGQDKDKDKEEVL